ncbi:NfeD family protein [Pseudoruegeria sp. HB172150]|uniref:NfeD family protein n=1 Tax=Pseudoruegeria sp. HB172150 TaxID=2721164 RepID=UPI001553D682|nr:hypothetical protein [Pseudoruegeria sp. HB172150]
MWALWWVWMAAALILGTLEVLVPGFIFLGFAIGAAVIGLMLLVGGPLTVLIAGSVAWMLVVFAAISVIAWILLRWLVGVRTGQVRIVERDINED